LKPTYGGSKKPCAKNRLEVDYNVGFSMDAKNYMLEIKQFNLIVRIIMC